VAEEPQMDNVEAEEPLTLQAESQANPTNSHRRFVEDEQQPGTSRTNRLEDLPIED
jgi:hypothetical protein